ncbi:CDP-alcohol phosphatidyltransferase family protein [Catenovulum adriaticum]|uniref:CDP-alcohol phosphatidyltransferase family protein n=1 Tax=Catenovulum adriaticum TaxID=2984846 RepID=A0ABY7AQY9_9ALTE|nr:CDP-alcohol phosphatidyltransferase family protein [Catenovulum sp. TS8]WAJ71687.1 CDP-alcohol phosphatidyltransferase family protein [Catenovulum sp. TS8]
MLDSTITPLVKGVLTPLVMLLNKCKITADQLTITGFIVGLLVIPLLAMQHWYAALGVIVFNRILDGLDGQLARYQKSSNSAGGFLDISLDFLFYAAVPLGFALADPVNNALPAVVLLVSFIGTGSSFLAFAIAAEKYQIERPQFKYKSFYYLHGLTEGTETILIFIAFCIWPEHFAVLAYLFALACFITVFTRIYGGYKTLKQVTEKA